MYFRRKTADYFRSNFSSIQTLILRFGYLWSDAHSLCNRIELSEPRDGSRAQNPQHVKRRHQFPTRLHLLCLVLLCARPFGKRVLYDREKSSEMTKYSVPSFGGHIDFSDDVIIYSFLVMSRTGNLRSQISLCQRSGMRYWD